ncbi:MAG TPA: Gfo/Idh/MocA family oxidoreductase [Thermoguttaceae bacterium]|nr:Gfo/Idh/MocA family oxidoreductase [Thermoguttaceae bacterium]
MIKVGITGLGFMGMIHYLAYQRVRGATVAAVCEVDRTRLAGDWRGIKGNFGPAGRKMNLAGIARYETLDKMLADPAIDLVDICLPPETHAEAVLKSLAAGKHVFCEKPIAIKPADAERMVKAARRAGRQLLIGQVLPFISAYRFAYRLVTSGKYGKLKGAHFKRIISDPVWMKDYWDPAKGGGPVIDLNIHDTHFVRLLCGMPTAVHTVGRMRGKVVELFHTHFLFKDPELMVTVAGGTIDQQGRPFTNAYEIYLDRATIVFDSGAGLPVTVLTGDGRVKRPTLSGGDPVDDFALEIQEVVRAARTNTPSPLLDGQLACDALALSYKQAESVAKRRVVKV